MTASEPTFPISVHTAGRVDPGDVEYGREKLVRVTRGLSRPVLGAHLELTHAGNPSQERPAGAKARLDLNGTAVRAHVAATTVREAVDLLEQRLREQVERAMHRAESQHLRHRGEGAWRHGDARSPRPAFFPRPVEEREVVRHKTFADHPVTAEAAVAEAEMLDHDFFLFREVSTGREAVVWRADDGWQVRGPDGTALASASVVPVDPTPVPELDPTEAAELLDTSDAPFVFFVDPGGRGQLCYRRYDGHYGLIQPPD